MAEHEFDKTLTFREFPPVSTEEWDERIKKDLKGADYKEKLKWDTGEGIEALPFYRQQNLSGEESPVYRRSSWEIREKLILANVHDCNKAALEALQNGASALAFHLPYASLKEQMQLEKLLKNIEPEYIGMHFGAEVSAQKILPKIKKLAENSSHNADKWFITCSHDPFAHTLSKGHLPEKEYIANLFLIGKNKKVFAAATDVYANAGATIVQQLALMLLTANEYITVGEELGLNAAETAGQFHCTFATGPLYFPEIAKYRAARLLLNRMFSVYDESLAEAYSPYIHAVSATFNKSRTDAHNNMLRSATECMSAAIGGADAITVPPYDEHFNDYTAFAARIARNTQLILKEESYIDKVNDPGAGSYYIEELTDKLCLEAWNLFREYESRGGLYENLKNGSIQNDIRESADRKLQGYQNSEQVLIGINKYPPEKDGTESAFSEDSPADCYTAGKEHYISVESLTPLNIEAALTNRNGEQS